VRTHLRLVPMPPDEPPRESEWEDDGQGVLALPLEPPPGARAPVRVPHLRRRVREALVAAIQLALEFRARSKRVRPAPSANEPPLQYLDMPATRGDCRGPGICPVFRCRHNLALRVKDSGAIKVDGGGPGTTLRIRGGASSRKVDRIVEIIIARAEELGTLCSLDLADAGARSIPEVAEILHVGEEIVRQEFLAASHEIEIAQARERRAEKRQLEGKLTAPLVQIRRKT
jgi:hypothetical protein